jgi:CheY-like chemotaxis protein/anti-sigma regulatory factor (Ser/Thr protein kinase)
MVNTRILVIEKDSTLRGLLIEGLRVKGHAVFPVQDRDEGLKALKEEKADIVLTDLPRQRARWRGFLGQIKAIEPQAKVIVMTEDGREETALEARRGGAFDCLKKSVAFWELYEAIERALGIQYHEINKAFVLEESKRIVMGNQIDQIWGVINQLLICAGNVCGEARVEELGLGLYEVIVNAIEHGNLEITFEEKCRAMERNSYDELLNERLSNPSYSRRRVTIDYHMIPEELHYIVRDEGKGFDWRNPPFSDPSNNLLTPCGRGVLLARIYLDHVEFNEKGNEVHLVKCGDRNEKKEENTEKNR